VGQLVRHHALRGETLAIHGPDSQAAKRAFGRRIVSTLALTIHRTAHAVVVQHGLEHTAVIRAPRVLGGKGFWLQSVHRFDSSLKCWMARASEVASPGKCACSASHRSR